MATRDSESTDLVVSEPQSPTLFHSNDPVEVVRKATEVAKALSGVLEDRKLYKNIQGKKHVLVEGWTLLGTMLGVFPVVEWTRKTPEGWEARVVARTMAGQTIGAAEACCTRDEKTWANRDDYALRSMAQTRATAKALRGPLGFVVSLAGYEATPEAEMPPTAPQPQRMTPARPVATHNPVWDDSSAPVPEVPVELSAVKRSLHEELIEFSPNQRDALIRKYSQVISEDGTKGPVVESLDKMLSPAISEKWAAATLGKIREARKLAAAKEGAA